jgi:trimethylamine-N-oxide reductase (cytochrome c)
MKSLLTPLALSYKKRVFSPNRIKYPLQRVDWEPGGDPETINAHNRGISKFKRISWDEATTIVANEIKRVQSQYTPEALCIYTGSHGESKIVNTGHGCNARLASYLEGYTFVHGDADSWVGWFWGGMHVWGMQGNSGLMIPQDNVAKDIAENSDMVLFWGGDLETTSWGWSGQQASRLCYWYNEIGIECVYICPDLNYAAAIHADKWIPVLPNTDAALQLAIAYTWMSEDTYDKDYIATHTVGFDKFENYVLGADDGIPKTPNGHRLYAMFQSGQLKL